MKIVVYREGADDSILDDSSLTVDPVATQLRRILRTPGENDMQLPIQT